MIQRYNRLKKYLGTVSSVSAIFLWTLMKKKYINCFIVAAISLLGSAHLYAQTQYDYYDSRAVSGGVNQAINILTILMGLVAIFLIIALVGHYLFVLLDFFKQKDFSSRESTKSDINTYNHKLRCCTENEHQSIEKEQKELRNNIQVDGFVLSNDGNTLLKGKDIDECLIPSGVKIISRYAFKELKNIRSLQIPDTVEEIEDYAFSELQIEKVHIPSSVSKWGDGVFFMCGSLKEVYIEEGLTRLGTNMFFFCEELFQIVIPNSISVLPYGIFSSCKSLAYINLPNRLKIIGDNAFSGCKTLSQIFIPESVECIGMGAFESCKSLSSIKLHRNLVGLENDTFSCCYNLSNVELEEGIVAISSCCFLNCGNLKHIYIPASIQHVDKDAFEGCNQLILYVPYGQGQYYRRMDLEDIGKIEVYKCSKPDNINELKKTCKNFLEIQKYKREQIDEEFKREICFSAKEEQDGEMYRCLESIEEFT